MTIEGNYGSIHKLVDTMTAYVNFRCQCGHWDVIMTDEAEPKTCDCGRVYTFVVELRVTEPKLPHRPA